MGVWRRALARDDPYDGLVQVLQEARMQIRRHGILIHHHRPFHLHVLGTLAILAVLLTSSMATHSQRHGILVAADAPAIEAQAAAGQLDPADSALLRDIAEANLAEIESGQLALERAQSDQIRQFARTMVDNHTQAMKETELFAREKNIRLPSGPGARYAVALAELKALKGAAFDRQYMSQSGFGQHKATVELLQKTQSTAKDPELKALAVKLLPIVQKQLQYAT
jgi:putative membrane protein